MGLLRPCLSAGGLRPRLVPRDRWGRRIEELVGRLDEALARGLSPYAVGDVDDAVPASLMLEVACVAAYAAQRAALDLGRDLGAKGEATYRALVARTWEAVEEGLAQRAVLPYAAQDLL